MSRANPIEASTVFVVSGGARGITAKCCIKLAERYQCKFILLGRTVLSPTEPTWAAWVSGEALLKKRLIETLLAEGEKPLLANVQKAVKAVLDGREVQQTLEAIRQVGGQVEYLSVDINDGPALREKLAGATERLGTVRGLIHGAGNLADKLIENKTVADFEMVYQAKVSGLLNLLDCLPPGQLNHLALFSSVAGFYGNSGQADYALANEILNKMAHLLKHRHPACRVVAFDWGPWDGGMVTPALKASFEQRNITVIPLETGAQMLVDELSREEPAPPQILLGSPLTPVPRPPAGPLRSYKIRRQLTLAGNPFLRDHQVGGQPVLPFICVIDWIANACEQLYPGYRLFSCEDNRVLKGVVFDSDAPVEYLLELQEVAKEAESGLLFEATISSISASGKLQYHYKARPKLLPQSPPAPLYTTFDYSLTANRDGAALYRDGTLFHGPSFQGVRRLLNISPERVTLECFLPPLPLDWQGQFPARHFNPYTVDTQLQGLLIWARHFYQAGSLPLRIHKVEQYRPLPFGGTFYASLEVQTNSKTGLVADVTAHDKAGQVYTRVTGAEVTISKRLNRLFAPAQV